MRPTLKLIYASLTLWFAMIPMACRRVDNVAYSHFECLGNEGWDPVMVLPFFPFPMDSIITPADRYDLILTLRYSPRTSTAVIPLEISEEDENGPMESRRLNIRLRDDNGNFIGRGGLPMYEISDTIKRNFKLPDGYLVELASLSPEENTTCIHSVGLSLRKSGQPALLPKINFLKR